jgi:hypothetical protein
MAPTLVAQAVPRSGGTYKRVHPCITASFAVWVFFTLATYLHVNQQHALTTDYSPLGLNEFAGGSHSKKNSSSTTRSSQKNGRRISMHETSSEKLPTSAAITAKKSLLISKGQPEPKDNNPGARQEENTMQRKKNTASRLDYANSTTTIGAKVQPPMSEVEAKSGQKSLSVQVIPDFANSHNSTLCDVVYSYEDIKRCFPPRKRKNMTSFGALCDSITTWPDVQRCLNGKVTTPVTNKLNTFEHKPRDYTLTIHLIGERNSGTKWVVEEMKKCFPRESFGLKIERDLFGRNKHFFHATYKWIGQQDHMVISIFREPVEWVAAMIEKPYHMTEHMNGFDEHDKPIPMDWQEFVKKPWAMKNRSAYDFRLLEMKRKNPHSFLPCRSGLQFQEVMPCRFDPGSLPNHLVRTQNPVYELKRGGAMDEPYQTILELRSDKIVNFLLEVPLLQDLGGFLAVRFEDLLRNGTRIFLEQVAELAGIKGGLPPECHPQGPKPDMIGRRKIPDGLKQWVESHLVLRTERILGYR